MTKIRFSLSEAHVIAFPGSVLSLFGVYPPIYRHGEDVFRGRVQGAEVFPKEFHSKEWLRSGASEGSVTLLHHQEVVAGDAVVLCLPSTLTPFFADLAFWPVRKGLAQAAVMELSRSHAIMWEAYHAAGLYKDGMHHQKELRAFHILCHHLMNSSSLRMMASMAQRQLSNEDFKELRALLRVNASHFGLPPPDLGK